MKSENITVESLRKQLEVFKRGQTVETVKSEPTKESVIVENPVAGVRGQNCPELQSIKKRHPDFYHKMMNWD